MRGEGREEKGREGREDGREERGGEGGKGRGEEAFILVMWPSRLSA